MAGVGISDRKDGMAAMAGVVARPGPLTSSRLLDARAGFRRRLRVTPSQGHVLSEVEDDYHHMALALDHRDGVATGVKATMFRVPWTTCPGAPAMVEATFTGVSLDRFVAQGGKTSNCTHLYDLALLAAAHAADVVPLTYDILVSDPVQGRVEAELRRNGRRVLGWKMVDNHIVDPAELAGAMLTELGPWIGTLDRDRQEHARLLRWGTILAHGRTKSMETRSRARDLPLGQCYTFQPEMAARARYVPGTVLDFSRGDIPLLESASGNGKPTGSKPWMKDGAAGGVRGETA